MDMSLSDDDDSCDEVEKEIFESLLLRYRLSDHGFPWRAFKAAGWQFKNSSYSAPNGRRFASANDIQEQFDRFAVPKLFSNLQSFESTATTGRSDDDNTQDDQEIQRLRRDFLKELHRLTVKSELANRAPEDDDDDDGTRSKAESQEAPARRTLNRKREAKSATVAEKGSDLYLTKGRRKRNSKLKTSNPPSVSADDLSFPTLQECMEFVEKLSVKNVEQIEASYERHFEDWRFLLFHQPFPTPLRRWIQVQSHQFVL